MVCQWLGEIVMLRRRQRVVSWMQKLQSKLLQADCLVTRIKLSAARIRTLRLSTGCELKVPLDEIKF